MAEMLVMILGVVSLALWLNFAGKPSKRHTDFNFISVAVNLLWLVISIVAVVIGYVLLATG